ncbi:Anthocyanidin 3-O-glucosyltransferase 5 [Sesamum alatum]|uniref:Glycosyltransferase n=1 Tax=Sesamum alatum TaxID=300844 RepID=A0AAE1YA52_9LAMI|nr:Anthocyanidin 3-O-glucosyltransferase 5 [Sesamum alatum]
MESSCRNLNVAILASPGMGHLIPVVVLGNRLAAHHSVRVTVLQVTTAASPPESELLNLPVHKELVQIIQLPPVDISHLVGPSTQVVTQLCLMVREALPVIRSAIAAMGRRPDALFVDHFGTDALPIAAEFNIAKYVYIPSTAWFTAVTVYCPVLDQEIEGQYVDQLEDLIIPGCKPVRPEEVVDPMLDRNDQQYDEYVRMGKQIPLFDGILLNSWEDLEPKTILALRENETLRSVVNIPIYPVGPMRRPVEPASPTSKLKGWLDQQANESVLFVSFGSGGMLSAEQITELAWGLELSRQRFIWVVRPPTRGRVDDAFFNIGNSSDGTPSYLPKGFLTRTRDVGLLVPQWAPQVEILSHPAIGGFLSHCGWNSMLESITSGVPIIAWPLYAEQRLNATFLVEEVGVAVRPRVVPTKQVVGREEIERLVRSLIEHEEGQGMRDKAKQLKLSAMDGLGHGGSSYKSMCEILSRIG